MTDRGQYVLIQTPSNPDFHWGNYIIFESAPILGDYEKWRGIYESEFQYLKPFRHMTFTWDKNESLASESEIENFKQAGFHLDRAKVLSTSQVNAPPKMNGQIQVRALQTDSEWEEAIHLQVECREPQYDRNTHEVFKRRQFLDYKKMHDQGLGHRYGAFLNGQLVGELGIFHENGIARFQNVCTHPEFRRQGICGTLVYQAAKQALTKFPIQTLVMEADADYHAASIYESVGFKSTEENQSLSWWIR